MSCCFNFKHFFRIIFHFWDKTSIFCGELSTEYKSTWLPTLACSFCTNCACLCCPSWYACNFLLYPECSSSNFLRSSTFCWTRVLLPLSSRPTSPLSTLRAASSWKGNMLLWMFCSKVGCMNLIIMQIAWQLLEGAQSVGMREHDLATLEDGWMDRG